MISFVLTNSYPVSNMVRGLINKSIDELKSGVTSLFIKISKSVDQTNETDKSLAKTSFQKNVTDSKDDIINLANEVLEIKNSNLLEEFNIVNEMVNWWKRL